MFRSTRASALVLLAVLTGGALPSSVASAAGLPAAGRLAGEVKPSQLPIRSITLYRSGVGSFQRRGQVEGTTTVQLRFDTEQINDLLKSMVVLDLSGKGRVGGVSYASRDPLTKRLASFGINIADEPSLSTILGRLRGAPVSVTTPDGAFSGTVIGGESRPQALGEATTPVPVSFLNILTDKGIKSLNLSVATNIEVLDADLAKELQRALSAVAEHRADRSKAVDVTFNGEGRREVVVGYVQETPVWKASYRLILPEGSPGKAEGDPAAKERLNSKLSMQGWAIVENTTDEDWTDVDLALVSGQPVGFRMDLYQPLYATRPMLPVPTVQGAAPRIFEGGTGGEKDKAGAPVAGAGGMTGGRENVLVGKAVRARRDMADAAPAAESAPMYPGAPAPQKAMLSAGEMMEYGAAPQATATDTGEIFEFRLDHPVTVERQRSAMLPIIGSPMSGRRVSIFTVGSGTNHPMHGVELLNDAGIELLPGPIAVYDGGTYAGDAQIGHVPAGDKRLLAYSVDLEVDGRVESTQAAQVQRLRIVRGMIEMTSLATSTSVHHFANKDAKQGRTLIVESPRDPAWTLKQPAKPYETTDSLHRFALDLEPGKSVELKVVQERTMWQQLEVITTNVESLLAYRQQGAAVSERVVEAVRRAGELSVAIREVEERQARLAAERQAITVDQDRLRSNMTSIDRASPLYAKYMTKLTEQETRLDTMGEEQHKAEKDLIAARAALDQYLANLSVE
jgi:hypothetical protein